MKQNYCETNTTHFFHSCYALCVKLSPYTSIENAKRFCCKRTFGMTYVCRMSGMCEDFFRHWIENNHVNKFSVWPIYGGWSYYANWDDIEKIHKSYF